MSSTLFHCKGASSSFFCSFKWLKLNLEITSLGRFLFGFVFYLNNNKYGSLTLKTGKPSFHLSYFWEKKIFPLTRSHSGKLLFQSNLQLFVWLNLVRFYCVFWKKPFLLKKIRLAYAHTLEIKILGFTFSFDTKQHLLKTFDVWESSTNKFYILSVFHGMPWCPVFSLFPHNYWKNDLFFPRSFQRQQMAGNKKFFVAI